MSHTIGGDSLAYAQVLKEKFVYELLLENNKSKVLTRMRVYATSIDEAKTETYLNGWTVLDAKELPSDRSMTSKSQNKRDIILNEDSAKFDATPIMKSSTEDNVSSAPLSIKQDNVTDNSSNQIIPNIPSTQNTTDTKKVGVGTKDNSTILNSIDDSFLSEEILPSDPRLKLVTTLYFDLGSIRDNGKTVGEELSNFDVNKRYIIFGNADEVTVVPNTEYNNNFELSYKRALYIKEQLRTNKIPESNLKTYGLGTKFLAVDTIDSNELNRRVDIYEFR